MMVTSRFNKDDEQIEIEESDEKLGELNTFRYLCFNSEMTSITEVKKRSRHSWPNLISF